MIRIEWKTQTGKSASMEHVTKKELIGDHNYTKSCDEIRVKLDNCNCIIDSVNDTDITVSMMGLPGNHPAYGRKIQMYCPPEAVQMYREYQQRFTESLRTPQKTEKNKNLCPHCGTYCYGDCQLIVYKNNNLKGG